MRSALHRAGAAALSQLLEFPTSTEEGRTRACPCGRPAHYRERRSKPVLTVVGQVEVLRPYYLCVNCGVGQFPVDVELDIENGIFPGVRRMQAIVGQEAPFDHGREQMKVLTGLEVTTKSVERTAEAIGADIAQREQAEIQKALQWELPVVAGEPLRVLYVQMDGTGFRAEERDGRSKGQDRWPAGPYSGSQTGTRLHPDDVGSGRLSNPRSRFHHVYRSHRECGRGWPAHLCGSLRMRLSRALQKVVIGDGAEWIWNLVALDFSDTIQIVDHLPCRQHLCEVARKRYPNDEGKQKAWMKIHQKRLLDRGKIEKLVAALRSIESDNPAVAEKIRTAAHDFDRNAERMRYP